jgi:hypothetical protein
LSLPICSGKPRIAMGPGERKPKFVGTHAGKNSLAEHAGRNLVVDPGRSTVDQGRVQETLVRYVPLPLAERLVSCWDALTQSPRADPCWRAGRPVIAIGACRSSRKTSDVFAELIQPPILNEPTGPPSLSPSVSPSSAGTKTPVAPEK